jgi:UDP-3-O-[3-hydroxymyristoyl] glucosamine N-acyltransferase
MKQTVAELAKLVDGKIIGDDSAEISGVGTLQSAQPGELSFIYQDKFRPFLQDSKASVVLMREGDTEGFSGNAIVVDNPYVAYAKLCAVIYDDGVRLSGSHASAVIDPGATIAESAWIGPNTVIEAGAEIGANVFIGPGSVVGKNAKVGAGTKLVANVTLYHECEVGEHGLIHAGAVIGSDGFGFANENKHWIKIPQVGRVIIGNEVEIGANTAIDRGAIGDTIIRDGVKIDNQVHIAHNVDIGEDSAIAGCVGIAGSTKIGKRFAVGGVSGINGHIEICDDVTCTGMSMVTRTINEPGVYSSGIPAEPNKEWRRNVVRFRQLDKLEKRIKQLEEKLKETSES